MPPSTISRIAAVATVLAIGSTLVAAQNSEETPKEIIAEQIRKQSYACDRPESAIRDPERSRPNAAVWLLKCEQASYRVRLVPDMAAHVERVD